MSLPKDAPIETWTDEEYAEAGAGKIVRARPRIAEELRAARKAKPNGEFLVWLTWSADPDEIIIHDWDGDAAATFPDLFPNWDFEDIEPGYIFVVVQSTGGNDFIAIYRYPVDLERTDNWLDWEYGIGRTPAEVIG